MCSWDLPYSVKVMKKVGGVSKGENGGSCKGELNKVGESGRENGRPLL